MATQEDTGTPVPEAVDKNPPSMFTMRSVLSALFWGVTGFVAGRVVGRWGDRPGSNIGARVLSWTGGIGGAILAAYTSIKTSRREHREEVEKSAAHAVHSVAVATPPAALVSTPTPTDDSHIPKPRVDSVEYAGAAIQSSEQRAV
jgi:hypothetical protein